MAKAVKKQTTAKKPATKTASKSTSKTGSKTATKKASASKSSGTKTKRKPNAAFMAPLTVSPALAEVVGSKPLPRTEIIKKIWDYIKKNDLQDKKNRRMINGDDKLTTVFGGKKQISMFELAKFVNDQVQKK
jgi:chromatin remodeling complex protein RSC6